MQRVLLSASIFLNICLIVAVAVAYGRLTAEVSPVAASISDQDFPAPVTSQSQSSEWGAVASEDYSQYAENLRARGLPEHFVRRIVIAEVDEPFKSLLREIVARDEEGNYWAADGSYDAYPMLDEEQILAIHALRRERELLLRSVLGLDLIIPEISPDITNPHFLSLSFLPEDKRRQLLELEELYTARTHSRATVSEFGAAEKEKEQAITNILTPQEREEYDLRMSSLSQEMRENLRGMDVSEYEFGELFKAHRDFSAQLGYNEPRYVGFFDVSPQSRRGSAFHDTLKGILGSSGYTEYARRHDHQYIELTWVTRKRGLDESIAGMVYSAHRNAKLRLDQLSHDTNMTPAHHKELSREIGADLEASLLGILGPEEYDRWGHQWISKFENQGERDRQRMR